jgi:hypothetical protein
MNAQFHQAHGGNLLQAPSPAGSQNRDETPRAAVTNLNWGEHAPNQE